MIRISYNPNADVMKISFSKNKIDYEDDEAFINLDGGDALSLASKINIEILSRAEEE